MRETRSSGSVRGASGDGRPYRERNLAVRPGLAEDRLPSSLALQVGRREGPVGVRERSPIRRRQGSLSRPTGAVVPRRSSQGGGGRRRSYEDHAPAGGGGVGRVDFLAPRLDQPSNRPVPRGTGVADPGAVPHYRSARVKAQREASRLSSVSAALASCPAAFCALVLPHRRKG
jgi:hypothetical protein